jgi:hypothetical protein
LHLSFIIVAQTLLGGDASMPLASFYVKVFVVVVDCGVDDHKLRGQF